MTGVWRTLFCAIWLLSLTQTASALPPPPRIDREHLAAFIEGQISEAMTADHIAGVSVAVVDRQGPILVRAFGLSRADKTADADTLFRVGSISKTVVWLALMQLQEQGRLSLDDAVADRLPARFKSLVGGGGRPPVRIRDLMSHAGGYEDSILGGFFVRDARDVQGEASYVLGHRLARVRDPGTLSVYSNYGAVLAGLVVEQVSGLDWRDYAERKIFRPLGMKTATFREPYNAQTARRRGLAAPLAATAASRLSDGFVFIDGQYEARPFEFVSNVAPAAAMSADARDMAVYEAALLDPQRLEAAGVLKRETFASTLRPLLANAPGQGAWRHGFMDFSAERGRPAFGHSGDLVYQHADLELFPQDGLAVFVAVNTASGGKLRSALAGQLIEAAEGRAPAAQTRLTGQAAIAEAERVGGSYRTLRIAAGRTEHALMSMMATFEVLPQANGDIVLTQGERPSRFAPVGDGVFVGVESPRRIAFTRTGAGMRYNDPFSLAPAERIDPMLSTVWLAAITAAAVCVSLWGVVARIRRTAIGKVEPSPTLAGCADLLCVGWLLSAGLGMLGVAVLGESSDALYAFPGPLLPLGLWCAAASAAATPVVTALALVGPWRVHGWGPWRWGRFIITQGVFLTTAATLWRWGFLGYSGW